MRDARRLFCITFAVCFLTFILAPQICLCEPSGHKVILSNIATGYFEDSVLSKTQRNAFKDLQSISVIVKQEYGYDKTKRINGYTLPLKQFTTGLFDFLGIKLTVDSPNNLVVDIKGTAESYLYTDNKLHYTGATVTGIVTLNIEGVPPYKTTFTMVTPPSSKIPDFWGPCVSFAPFEDAFSAYVRLMYKIVGPSFGWDSLLLTVESASNFANPYQPMGDGPGDGPVGNKPSISGMNRTPLVVACKVLAEAGNDGISVLTTALQDKNPDIRSNALAALADIKAPVPFSALIPFLDDNRTSFKAKYYLQELKGKHNNDDIVAAIAALKHKKAEVRNAAIGFLDDAKVPLEFGALIPLFEDKETLNSAEWYLRNLGSQYYGDVATLTAALQHKNIELRIAALRILKEGNIIIDFHKILPLLKDKKTEWWAEDYLKEITGQKFAGDIEKWKSWFKKNSKG